MLWYPIKKTNKLIIIEYVVPYLRYNIEYDFGISSKIAIEVSIIIEKDKENDIIFSTLLILNIIIILPIIVDIPDNIHNIKGPIISIFILKIYTFKTVILP